MTLVQAFFAYFATVIVTTSVLAVTRRNPVHSVLWMLLLFVHIAAVFVFLNAEFLAAIQVIIYAGAILVLFLFVLMLLNLRQAELEDRFQRRWPVGLVVAVGLLSVLGTALTATRVIPQPGPYSVEMMNRQGNLLTVGKVLYSQYLFPFEIAATILLVAIVGAVVLAVKRVDESDPMAGVVTPPGARDCASAGRTRPPAGPRTGRSGPRPGPPSGR